MVKIIYCVQLHNVVTLVNLDSLDASD